MLRAAMSIPANIVEGTGHQSTREFIRFLRIASGSASELEYHLLLAKDFGTISESEFRSLSSQAQQVRKMLYGLASRLSDKEQSRRMTP